MSHGPERHSRWAIAWLLFGGFLFGWGWFVGLFLLWRSRAWTLGEKLLGTFVIPGGLAASLAVGLILIGGESQTTPCVVRVGSIARCVPVTRTITSPSVLDYLGAIVLVMAPIMTAIYLASRGRAGASARLAQNPVPSS